LLELARNRQLDEEEEQFLGIGEEAKPKQKEN